MESSFCINSSEMRNAAILRNNKVCCAEFSFNFTTAFSHLLNVERIALRASSSSSFLYTFISVPTYNSQRLPHHDVNMHVMSHLKNMHIKSYKTIFLIKPDCPGILFYPDHNVLLNSRAKIHNKPIERSKN